MELRINITEDAYTSCENVDTNYGTASSLYVADRGESVDDKDHAYIKIPLDALPEGALIEEAHLLIYCSDAWLGAGNGSATDSMEFRYVNEPWYADNIKKSREPLIRSSPVSLLTVKDNDYDKYYSFNIKKFVDGWVAGTRQNYGLQMAIRASEGADYIFHSSEGTNKPYVLIKYSVPAKAPINLTPYEGSVLNLAEDNIFSWDYIPTSAGDTQTKWRLEFSNDQENWRNRTGENANTETTIKKGTFSEGDLYWRLKVKNSAGYYSPFSNTIKLVATQRPDTPVINTSGIINVYRPQIQWQSIATQKTVLMEIYDDEENLLWKSKAIYTSDNKMEVGLDLENRTQYTIKVKVANSYGLQSNWGETTLNTSFQTPDKPGMDLLTKYEGKGIVIKATNPQSGLRVLRNEVFKRKAGQGAFKRIAKIAKDGQYIDYAVASSQQYEYYIRSIGETNGYIKSDIKNRSIDFAETIILDVKTKDLIELYLTDGENKSLTDRLELDKATKLYSGRCLPVSEVGKGRGRKISFSHICLAKDEEDMLCKIYFNGNTILYRDSERLRYCSLLPLTWQKVKLGGRKATVTAEEVDYTEEV